MLRHKAGQEGRGVKFYWKIPLGDYDATWEK